MTNGPIGEDDLHAYVDGRLDDKRRAAVDAYLRSHAAAAEQVADWQRQRAALRAGLAAKLDEPVPARLRIANIRAGRSRRRFGALRLLAASLALLIAGGAIGWVAGGQWRGATRLVVVNDANAAFRTFVGETAHPVEVRASERDHLQQWLSNRLGQPIRTPDLTSFGYRLMGGRLLPAHDGAVAAQFMYDDSSGARLTLYLRNGESGVSGYRYVQDGAVGAAYWIDRGLGFAVSGPLTQERLAPLAEAVHRQLTRG